jgi:hypothetical protein
LTQPENQATYVAGYLDQLWASPCLDLYISRAIYSNSVSPLKCLIVISAIACDLYRDCKGSHDWRTRPDILPDLWAGFRLHPVQIFTFPGHYILILYISQDVLFLFVLLPVTYIETATAHTTGEQGRICFRLCGPALGFTLSG